MSQNKLHAHTFQIAIDKHIPLYAGPIWLSRSCHSGTQGVLLFLLVGRILSVFLLS